MLVSVPQKGKHPALMRFISSLLVGQNSGQKKEPLVSPSESGPMCYRAESARTRHETTVKRPMRELRFFAMIAGRRWNIAGSNRKLTSRWHQDGRRNTSVSAQGTMHHGQVQWSKSPQDSVTAFTPSETAQGCGILTLGNIS